MNDQATMLRRIHQHERKAKTVAIVSGKGGVGKSTTVVNMAIELKKRNLQVLLFDLDVGMGNIDLLIGQSATYSIMDFLKNNRMISECIETGPKGIEYIAGGSSLSTTFQMDQQFLERFLHAYNILTWRYDYIFFDLGAGASNNNLPFVLAADECIVITTPEPTAITDAYSMMKYIIQQQKDIPISVIMNRTEGKQHGDAALERFIKVVAQFLHVQVSPLGTLPNDPVVPAAVMQQIPYIIMNERAAISKALKKIVTNYTDTIQDTKTETFIDKIIRFLR